MPQRKTDPNAPYQSINNTAYLTGLSAGYVRAGCKSGEIPCIMCGKEYRVNIPAFLEMLQNQSMKGVRK